MRYFTIMSGLRGCYMPDSVYTVACKTRRELKSVLASEAENQDCDGAMVGLSKAAVAHIAAVAWRDSGLKRGQATLPFCLPFGHKPDRIGESPNYAFGIMVGHATRAEWKESQEESN